MSSLFPPRAHSWRLLTKWLTWASLGAELPPVPAQRRAVRSLPGVSAWWGGSSACLPHPHWSGSTPAALSSDQPQLIRAQLCENSLSFCTRKEAPRVSVCCVPCGCAPCSGGWAFFSLSLSLSHIVRFGFSWHSQYTPWFSGQPREPHRKKGELHHAGWGRELRLALYPHHRWFSC